jgi:4-amino-4-deoxychorismate lyase
MCLLFETIKIQNGYFQNLHCHSERMNNARRQLFGSKNDLRLEHILTVPVSHAEGIYKCRIEYNDSIQLTEILPYQYRKIKTLQIIHEDTISYPYKYSDRSCFDRLKKNSAADEILIVKNGFVTDTSFSNIIFYDGTKWFTPAFPLLKGTKRKELLEQRIISEREIKVPDLKNFKKARLINAMIGMDDGWEIAMNDISGFSRIDE